MRTLKQIAASRANGRLSKGPVTEAGKQRASRNALTHGLRADHTVLSSESAEGFYALTAHHVERIRPVDNLELCMVEDMVSSLWRLQRVRAVETRLIDDAASDPALSGDPLGRIAAALSTLSQTGSLALIHRYETRLHRMYQRTLQNLLLFRGLVPQPGCEDPANEPSILELPNEPSPNSKH